MHTITTDPTYGDTIDLLAIAFGVLHEPTPNNSIKIWTVEEKMADNSTYEHDEDYHNAAAECKGEIGQVAQYVLFNPLDYHLFFWHNPRMIHYIDRETMQKLVRRGIVGYLWGATVVLDKKVARGYIVVSADTRESALKSDKSIIVEINKLEVPDRLVTISEASTDWSHGPCPVAQDNPNSVPRPANVKEKKGF